MKPLPVDDKNPPADLDNLDDLIMWMAFKEAKALIKFDAVPKPIELKSDSPESWIDRAEYREILQQWEWLRALGDFTKTSELDSSDAMLFQKVVTLQAWFAMDRELADTCRRGPDMAKNTTSPETVYIESPKVCCVILSTDKASARSGAHARLAKAVDLGKNHPYLLLFSRWLSACPYTLRAATLLEVPT